MAEEFVTGLPSVRKIQNLIRDRQKVEIKLLTGDIITGWLVWQDSTCLCLETNQDGRHQIWKQAIAFLKY